MCGIGGWVLRTPDRGGPERARDLLAALAPRGPDDEGVCLLGVDPPRAASFATDRTMPDLALPRLDSGGASPHRAGLVATRFAIVDPTGAGHQPFASSDGTVIGIFNGEVYNHVELRAALEAKGTRFRSRCDTEVLVEGFRLWGEDLWRRLDGFWAVALVDRAAQRLTLSRDRFGIAPLYLRETPDGLFFSSLLGPLVRLDPDASRPDRLAAAAFVDTELKDFGTATLFTGIRAMPPAATWTLPIDPLPSPALPGGAAAPSTQHTYWTLPDEPFGAGEITVERAADRLLELLVEATTLRLRADVPVAFELSGGLDSSSIVAAATLAGAEPITYTLKHPTRDEEPIARQMKGRYPLLDYRVHVPDAGFAPEEAMEFLRLHEEPYHAPNAWTHYGMRQAMARDGFRVAIAGSGGDEALAGYEFDFWPAAAFELRAVGLGREALLHDVVFRAGTPTRAAESLFHGLKAARRRLRARSRAGTPPGGGPGPLDATGLPAAESDSGGRGAAGATARDHRRRYAKLDLAARRRFHFRVGMLPHYLVSDDRYSMSIPVEHRLPFLDHRLVEFTARLRAEHLFHRGWTKYALRRAMSPLLPRAIAWRRVKMGFPLDMPRFLAAHRAWLEPDWDLAREGLPLEPPPPGWNLALRSDPQRLWRGCVTGAWLRSIDDHPRG